MHACVWSAAHLEQAVNVVLCTMREQLLVRTINKCSPQQYKSHVLELGNTLTCAAPILVRIILYHATVPAK